MEKNSPEIPIVHKNRLIQELTQGGELVNELKILIDKPFGDDKYSVANDLLVKISSLFTCSISMMNHNHKDDFPGSACKEDSDDNSKTSVFKDRRGCCKKRKKSHTSIQIIPNLIDDGYAWRKYGQKRIQNAKQPRNYFRCTHKFDQGCQATKQVQKTEDEPPMYHITYYDKHTCKNPTLTTPQLIFDTTHFNDSKNLISFESSNNFHEGPTFPNFHFVKNEYSLTESPSSDRRHILPHRMKFGSSEPVSVLSSESDHTDMISYFSATSAPSDGFDQMDMIKDFGGFCDNFDFGFQHCYT